MQIRGKMVTILEDHWSTCNIEIVRNGWVKFITNGSVNCDSCYNYGVCCEYVMMRGGIITISLIDYNG